MKLLKNSSISGLFAFLALSFILASCAEIDRTVVRGPFDSSEGAQSFRIAVFPIHNISASRAPLKEIRRSLTDEMVRHGLSILDDDVVEDFFFRHGIRYSGGISRAKAAALREETGVEAILITSLELFSDIPPPKAALSARLVTTEDFPGLGWTYSMGLAGDDAPGPLGLFMIDTSHELMKEAAERISESLARYLAGKKSKDKSLRAEKRFRPRSFYRSSVISMDKIYGIAVLPFYNVSERKYAGEIMQLHFINQLRKMPNFKVIEPGEIRETLLAKRVFMDDGLSLANADVVFNRLDADLLLTGNVLDYQDYQGTTGKPKVDFSAHIIERKSREFVWASKSCNEGDDGVFLFGLGKVTTAHTMADRMVRPALETIFEAGEE